MTSPTHKWRKARTGTAVADLVHHWQPLIILISLILPVSAHPGATHSQRTPIRTNLCSNPSDFDKHSIRACVRRANLNGLIPSLDGRAGIGNSGIHGWLSACVHPVPDMQERWGRQS
ncbi:hypothetical protein C8R47DRAFT_1159112 [Mycena vitilis]|nr:hypothetical protein C8R47DRAFT_1159112 [Mycena vitilis]